MKRLALIFALAAALSCALAAAASAKDIYVDDTGTATNVPAPPGKCGQPNYSTIQAAVTASAAGDRILVCQGTYSEQVDVMAKSLSLVGLDHPAITAPAVLAPPGALVHFEGPQNSSIKGFVIKGPFPVTGCGTGFSGVLINTGAAATVAFNEIRDIVPGNSALLGCQAGSGIQVGSFIGGNSTPGTATIVANVINRYEKTGIVVDEVGTKGTVSGNLVSGVGPTTATAQNGIQFGYGSTGEASYNAVANNQYTGPAPADSAGVILVAETNGVRVSRDALARNDAGVLTGAVTGMTIQQNAVSHNNHDGIALGTDFDLNNVLSPSTQNTVQSNDVRDNGANGILADAGSTQNAFKSNEAFGNGNVSQGTYDCNDKNGGPPANTWTGNQGGTSNPPTICPKPKGDDGHHGGGDDHGGGGDHGKSKSTSVSAPALGRAGLAGSLLKAFR